MAFINSPDNGLGVKTPLIFTPNPRDHPRGPFFWFYPNDIKILESLRNGHILGSSKDPY